MNYHRTHLQVLDDCAQSHGALPLFWIPDGVNSDTKAVESWTTVTRKDFHALTVSSKRFYESLLRAEGIPAGSTIGVWLSGNNHTDLVHVLGVTAAGYVPQVFSLYYSHSQVVYNLLIESHAKALVIDAALLPDTSGCPVKVVDVSSQKFSVSDGFSPLTQKTFGECKDETAIIHHTSGSTGKLPRLIPWTNQWVASVFKKFKQAWMPGKDFDSPDNFVRLGNFNHCATWYEYLGCIFYGGSIIMPSSLLFNSEELKNMIQICGLNRLCQFSSLMVPHLDKARHEPAFFGFLRDLRSLMYGGVALPPSDEQWAFEKGLNMANIFASSECGLLMVNDLGTPSSTFKPLRDVSCEFMPLEPHSDSPSSLFELVILPNSPDLPAPHFLDRDGKFYTGDLFEKIDESGYVFRGRKDDWIKIGLGYRCDTKAIEDTVRRVCKDMMFADCVVVGNNRPAPVLFIEPKKDTGELDAQLIVDRMKEFNASRFPHERVDNVKLIKIVESGVLPRTAAKGNIRRKAVEEQFSKELDEIFSHYQGGVVSNY